MLHLAMNPGNALLFLQGIVNHGVADLVAASERQLSDELPGTRKKVINILIEAFQNLRHGARHFDGDNFAGVWFRNDHYEIVTGNVVTNESRDEINRVLNKLNNADGPELTTMRGQILRSPAKENSSGLGLLTMRQRSNRPLNAEWVETDLKHSYFYLRILIPISAA